MNEDPLDRDGRSLEAGVMIASSTAAEGLSVGEIIFLRSRLCMVWDDTLRTHRVVHLQPGRNRNVRRVYA